MVRAGGQHGGEAGQEDLSGAEGSVRGAVAGSRRCQVRTAVVGCVNFNAVVVVLLCQFQRRVRVRVSGCGRWLCQSSTQWLW